MTYRELRASWRRLTFFTLCLSLGVGSIVTLRSAIRSVNAYTSRESRAINSGDVALRNSHGWTDDTTARLDGVASAPAVVDRTRTIQVPTMLRPVGDATRAKMVELKGVEPAYPLYGDLKLADGAPYAYDRLAGGGALVSPSLAAQMDIGPGSVVKLGNREFTVRGVIAQEPDSGLGAFNLGSRVIVSLDDLRAAGILGFSPRTRDNLFLKVRDADYDRVLADLKRELKDRDIAIRGYREAEAGLNSTLSLAADYLSLVGLAILVLGGVGVWSVTRVYVAQRWRSIAVLKCLGCTNGRAVLAYTLQMVAIGLAGGVAGVALAWAILAALRTYLAGGPLGAVEIALSPGAVAQGLAVGELVALLFSLTPLLGIRDIRPNLVLRAADPRQPVRWNAVRVLTGLVVGAGLLGVSSWQAGSWRVGAIFLGGLLVTGAASAVAGEALLRTVRVARRVPLFSLRHAVLGLSRPGNQTRAVLVAVGLGVFFLVGAAGVQRTLLDALDAQLNADLPDLYLVDIQEDQREGVADLIKQNTGIDPVLVPTLRARIAALDGAPLELDKIANPRDRSRLGREYTLTTRPTLDANEKVVAGEWWGPEPSADAEISVEESLARDFNLGVGHTMTFDIQGERVTGRVTSVRSVDWQNSRIGFMIVVRPGGLGDIPLVYIGALKGPPDAADRGRLARAVSDAYSNVSIIDARDVIAIVGRVLSSLSFAVSVVGAIVLAAGLMILTGALAMSRYVREYETALLKTLGAGSRTVLGVLLTEHALVGLLSGVVGSALGVGLAWVVSRYLFELAWTFDARIPLAGVAGATALAAVVGTVSSADLLVLRPLRVLKREES
jgi:putative ABC transport system permease protein